MRDHAETRVVPRRAMVLAAGLGLRMRPITDRLPKPLIAINGRSMLDRSLDALATVGVDTVVVNTHHLGWMIEAHLRDRCSPRIVVSPETERLETGGGIRNVLGRFAGSPFYAVNGDILWRDGKAPALNRLAAAWDSAVMDALLLLHPVSRAIGYDGQGDFLVHSGDRDGAVPIERRGMRQSAPYLFAGLQILHPRLFAGSPAGPFSLNITYDLAIARCRLFGIIHDGGWCHVGTPGDIAHATDFLVAGGEPRIPV